MPCGDCALRVGLVACDYPGGTRTPTNVRGIAKPLPPPILQYQRFSAIGIRETPSIHMLNRLVRCNANAVCARAVDPKLDRAKRQQCYTAGQSPENKDSRMSRQAVHIDVVTAMGAGRVIANDSDIQWQPPGEQKVFRGLTDQNG